MEQAGNRAISRTAIVAFYRKATYCYVAPFACLLLAFIIPPLLGVGLVALIPAALAGLFFTQCGFAAAKKNSDLEKKDVGYANLILGVIILGLGLLGLALAYVMTA